MAACQGCGADNPAGKLFCSTCGSSLAAVCPACLATVQAGEAFCGDCGHRLTPAATDDTADRPTQPVVERRVCSVLFCDLVGFTALSESRDPEEVRGLLSRYFETTQLVIGRYGGQVEKFIGDAVMAVWGTPVATEGDAERAVRAALDVVTAVAELGADVGAAGLTARAGVVTGEVAVTIGAVNQGMVAGDAVNTAARVQTAAQPGRVLVDTATRRLAASAIGFEDAGRQALKGKAEPEQLWQATRVLSVVGGAQRVDGLEAPLIGRDAELRLIKDLFHATADRRLPRLLVVSGAAGVGKSRLGWEFEKYADGLTELVFWYRGRCLSYGDGVAFWALAEIVRQRLEIAEEDPQEIASAKLVAGLDTLMPDPQERGYVGLRLARLLGVPYPDDAGSALGREELFAGWRLFFERLATQGTLVLMVEDAQYADSGLLDFLDHLVDWSRNLPILVLVFARSELEQTRPGFGIGRSRTTMSVDPLDAASMDQLADSLVAGLPSSARAAVATQAQGIPLFAVEAIRSLIDRDVVIAMDGTYRLVGDVGELTIPASLHALLAARLDALEPDVRLLVADAAVLGSSFPVDSLSAVSGRPSDAVRTAAAELVRRGVFEVSADVRSPERGNYRFTQEMLRQVAYETLSRRDRKIRHLRVAAHLRSSFANDGEEVVDVITRHYLDAMEAMPGDEDVDDLHREAVDTLVRAGERAERTGATSRAATNYTDAARMVEAAADGPARRAAHLWDRAADANDRAAHWAAAIEAADRARGIYQECGDHRSAARVQIIAGRALGQSGRPSEGRPRLLAAVDGLRDNPDVDTVRALSEVAALEALDGDPQSADRYSAEALALIEQLDAPPSVYAFALTARGLFFSMNSSRQQAAMHFRESARVAELAELADVNEARNVLGLALLNLSYELTGTDPAEALVVATRAVTMNRRTGRRLMAGLSVTNVAHAKLALGDWDGASADLADAMEQDNLQDIEELFSYAAWIAAMRGDVDAATDYLAHTARVQESEDQQGWSLLSVTEGFIAVARGDPATGLARARRSLELTAKLGIDGEFQRWAWPLTTRCAYELGDADATAELLALFDGYREGQLAPMQRAERALVLARISAGQGEPDAATRLAAAVAQLRTGSTPFHLAHGLLDLADFLRPSGDPAGDEAWTEAAAIATALGCTPLLVRANRAAAERPQGATAP